MHTGVLGPEKSPDLAIMQGRHPSNSGFGNGNHQLQTPAENSAMQAASAAAERAAAFLSSSKEGIEELLRSPNSPGRPLDRCVCVCV